RTGRRSNGRTRWWSSTAGSARSRRSWAWSWERARPAGGATGATPPRWACPPWTASASAAAARTPRTNTSSWTTSPAASTCWCACSNASERRPGLRLGLLPRRLRLIQRLVRGGDQRVGVRHRRVVLRHARARCDPGPSQLRQPLVEALAHALDEHHRPLTGRVGEQRHELVAAVAGGHVHRPRLLRQDRSEDAQHLVAGEVAVAVVVFLEVVEIEDDGDQLAAAAGGGELAGELALELAPVGQAGERVRERERAHLLEEAGVLDGDGGLVGQRAEQLELVLVERPFAGAGEQCAERTAAVEQGRSGHRRVAEEVAALGLDERLLRRVDG